VIAARSEEVHEHPFVRAPHRTLLGLALPVLLSLVAEPLTGLVDTAFVARLGSIPVAAMGVAITLLSSLFWVFNFLGIGTQTSVARSLGSGDRESAREAATTAAVTALLLGVLVSLLAWSWLDALASFMGANDEVREEAVAYLQIRFVAAPAVLATLAAFGALRGLQDMRRPFWIAASLNLLNVALDWILVFGAGPIPALGLRGAAWGTTVSQWFGAVWALAAARSALGGAAGVRAGDIRRLFVVGRDLAMRTALLLLFLLLATRAATRLAPEAGAAHQAIRQIWMLGAFVLDAFAASAQSLVGYFLGAGERKLARRVASVACSWALGVGGVLAVLFVAAEPAIAWLLVPTEARATFAAAWLVAALAQPLNALSFATDGIHWGAGDYRYLRNVMLLATATGALLLAMTSSGPTGFLAVWLATDFWIAVRATFGVLRVWPGIGAAPIRAEADALPTRHGPE
jgi:MATE family multidrug resistance protein